MTSALNEPSGRDGRPDRQSGGKTEENQLDLFEILSRVRTGISPAAGGNGDAGSLRVLSAETHVVEPHVVDPHLVEPPVMDHGSQDPATTDIAWPGNVEKIGSPAARDFLDVGGTDADELRRLEQSIRWLMTAGTAPQARAATAPFPSVIGVSPLDPQDDETLLLDPDTLFPPRAPRRAGNVAAGAAKILLVSAIAAPSAYLVASWLQFPGAAPTSETVAVAAAAPTPPSGVQVAALTPSLVVAAPSPEAPQIVHDATEAPAQQTPEHAAAPQPTSRAAETVLAAVAIPPAAVEKAAPEPPAAPAAQPAESVSSAPASVVPPAKPALRRDEIAMMVERGRVLFEAGDLAAARLFFRRAAYAGDAAAAIAMGATYDPEVLAQRFIRGIEADPQEAQRWYERAREMGRRVEMLAQRR